MEDRELRIDGLNLASNLRGNGSGIDWAAKKNSQVFGGVLVNAEIELWRAGVGERFRASICNDADDRGPVRLAPVQPDALAHGVLVGPVGARRGFIDDGDRGGVLKILIAEEASACKCHAEQVEVFRRNDGSVDRRSLITPEFEAFADQWRRIEIVTAMPQRKRIHIPNGSFFNA